MKTIEMTFIGNGMHTKTFTSIYWYELPNKKGYIAIDTNGNLIDVSKEHPMKSRVFFVPA